MRATTDVRQPGHSGVDSVLGAIAEWVNHRRGVGRDDAFWSCNRDEVRQVAKDLGITASDLREVAERGPHAADLLQKMLAALDIDAAALARSSPATLRDLQRLCGACRNKGRCERELAKGSAAAQFRKFCPNAFTLDALLEQKHLPFEH